MIEFKNIFYSYHKKKGFVLNNVNLIINEGDIHGVLGHNGAGKTTLFRIALGILNPDSGQVTVHGDSLNKYKKHMAYMPENNGIYNKLTGIQNLEFRASISKNEKSNIKQDCEQMLQQFNLFDKRNDFAGTYSNGMKKRLSLACALISRPKILFLDEPTNGLDPESHEMLIDVLKELKQKETTAIINSHNLDFINDVCNHISIIENGAVVYSNEVGDNKVKEIYFKNRGKRGRESEYNLGYNEERDI